ncbi:MAG: FprA family A-type flavoprotein [Lachnospiraceae bacterium]|jgi:flavorubredoxin|nr:FprA family A-type flavoprotein [Lachnospiraceae bacterium]
MDAVKIKDGIYWVGALDWNARTFHGYSTQRGITYNAYLLLDDKITLIDTVKNIFTDELLERISSVVDPKKIDVIVSNHVEMDHSGALPAMRAICPDAQIYASGPSGVKGLTSHYGDLGVLPVKTGDSIKLGKRTLEFVGTPMLHWPDNMVTWCPEERVLFSNDAFGQHYATTQRFDDQCPLGQVMDEAQKYYGNILMCYEKQAMAAWEAVSKLGPEIIAPSHGVCWRSHVKDILDAYGLWGTNEPTGGALVVYDSMWHSTEKMALTILEAFASAGVDGKLLDLKDNHISDIIPQVLTHRYIAVGSPTLNNNMMPTVASFLCYLRGLSPKNRKAFAFGSFGWGGQSIKQVEDELRACGFDIILEMSRINYIPKEGDLQELRRKVMEAVH